LGTICGYTIEEYLEKAKEFHGGHLAPGVIIAGFMVDLATRNLPKDILYEVICETSACLPDAVQVLTPCTAGNQWMKIIDVGRFAMTFYDKYTGEGVRVNLDTAKLGKWPALKEWFLKLKPKKEQDTELIIKEILEAGTDILEIRKVSLSPEFMVKRKKKTIGVCPICNEAFRSNEGDVCPACKKKSLPYASEVATVKTV
jgi:formylmethanofuran dehydrogenase subunit E